MPYVADVTMSESELHAIRLSTRYRTGIWLARAGTVISIACVAWVLVDPTPAGGTVVLLVLLFLTVPLAFYLLFMIRGVAQRSGLVWAIDPAYGRILFRDFAGRRPRL